MPVLRGQAVVRVEIMLESPINSALSSRLIENLPFTNGSKQAAFEAVS